MRKLRSEEAIIDNWTSDPSLPIVSICCITYNHGAYIEDALEGFFTQKTNFPYEILIHDDASTDRTPNIINEYHLKYPNIIKPVYQRENQFSRGEKINFKYNFTRSKGKFIALCEGDDYWIDKLKLQKQIAFLIEHSNYSGSAHQSIVLDELDHGRERMFSRHYCNVDINTDDLLAHRIFHTASFIFKKDIVTTYGYPKKILSGDRYLFLLCSLFGPIRFFNDPMCVYRKNQNGLSNQVTYELLKNDLFIPDYLYRIDNRFPKYRYLSFIHKTLILYPVKSSQRIIFNHFFQYLFFSFSIFPKNLKELFIFSFKTFPLKFLKILK